MVSSFFLVSFIGLFLLWGTLCKFLKRHLFNYDFSSLGVWRVNKGCHFCIGHCFWCWDYALFFFFTDVLLYMQLRPIPTKKLRIWYHIGYSSRYYIYLSMLFLGFFNGKSIFSQWWNQVCFFFFVWDWKSDWL